MRCQGRSVAEASGRTRRTSASQARSTGRTTFRVSRQIWATQKLALRQMENAIVSRIWTAIWLKISQSFLTCIRHRLTRRYSRNFPIMSSKRLQWPMRQSTHRPWVVIPSCRVASPLRRPGPFTILALRASTEAPNANLCRAQCKPCQACPLTCQIRPIMSIWTMPSL